MQLPDCLRRMERQKLSAVRAFAACLAAAPKMFGPESVGALLAGINAHGPATLVAALKRREICGLLLGLLCHPPVLRRRALLCL